MAMEPNLDDYLSMLGFDSDTIYVVPADPADAALAGVNAFVREHSPSDNPASIGVVHLTGSSVEGHSAPLKAVGALLSALQDGIDAIGASIQGIVTLTGALPSSVTGRTQLSMIASPQPGSVAIQVSLTLDRMEDLYPEGRNQSLFDLEDEIEARPLADMAFGEFSSLIKDLSIAGPDKTEFLDRLTDHGPRVASAMKAFCDSVDKGALDVDLEWEEPGREPEMCNLSHEAARHAARVIQNANIDSETTHIVGKILTLTMSSKDKLRVLTDAERDVTLAVGSISPSDIVTLHPGDRVVIEAERCVSRRPGGRSYEKLIGVSLQKLSALRDKDACASERVLIVVRTVVLARLICGVASFPN